LINNSHFTLNNGSRFIDLKKDYNEIELFTYFLDKNNNNIPTYYNPIGDHTLYPYQSFKGDAFPDLFEKYSELSGRYLELRKIYSNARKKIVATIYSSAGKKCKIDDVLNILLEFGCKDVDEAAAILKVDIAKGLLIYNELRSGKFIILPNAIEGLEDRKRFLESISDEIVSKSRRIELLINHNVSKGSYREMLVRDILRKYMPKKYDVVTGFIEGCDRQCDIIIYDSLNFSPFFRENDLVVVPQQSVRAVIEVKSTLATDELKDSLDLLWDVSRLRNYPAPFFKAIFAFKNGYATSDGLADAIGNFYTVTKGEDKKHDIISLFESINAVCVLDSECLVGDYIDYDLNDPTVRPRLYQVQSKSSDLKVFSTTFLNELFSFLDVEKHAKQVNLKYFNELKYDTVFTFIKNLSEDDWSPIVSFKNEHQFDKLSIWKRVSAVQNWRNGILTIDELEKKYFDKEYEEVDYLKEINQSKIYQPNFSGKRIK